LRGCDE